MHNKFRLRRFSRDRRGISTILGAILFVMVVLLAFDTMLRQVKQYDTYYETVKMMTQSDLERLSERLEFRYPAVVLIGSNEYNFLVDNTGGVDVNVTRIYIYDESQGNLTILTSSSNPYEIFRNGYVASAKSNHAIYVKTTVNLVGSGKVFRLKLATERGRIFSTLYPMTPLVGVSYTFAHDAMTLQSSVNNVTWVTAKVAVGDAKSAMYRINMTNYGSQSVKIGQSPNSMLFIFDAKNNQISKGLYSAKINGVWHVVTSSGIGIPAGATVTLLFSVAVNQPTGNVNKGAAFVMAVVASPDNYEPVFSEIVVADGLLITN